ncbi:uncharacterized protein EV420DRAFT_566045 [Desarmillaria tabescens]|uniref:Uncharacterized protein n=1 Tax=Armillaria tabescens TaxID=1929756 RepID=A0AA39J9K5_ARMTA|nr:uncharacterized protein EV420DRAFT_1208721 [Desarmillaria tabescens]XP_060328897.1 uncharacterized protein EV420DRAFT_566045 [Desarmillaria tabescens]KAK0438696.1 hypothetical protein EV420DRAFT_1208721 [Desarmillaria tabescens]KAK0455387.1 hypothetical protein EV420DRAFT_566045 [Desarmillaria tabescens]
MAMKRKFDDAGDATYKEAKQLKCVPFPHCEPDNDVAMSDAEPLYSSHHMRASSNASSASSDTDSPSTESPAYPNFEIYPLPFFNSAEAVDQNSHPYSDYSTQPNIGLLQPHSNFVHHGSHCSQIPKLRVACASGVHGQRTMWSFCEQCGAISMVDSD